MIFPIRPTTTETRRIDDVNVRATPAVTGITAAHGFNQPGVVVTIGDGARTLARSGQQPQSGNSAQESRATSTDTGEAESVFSANELDASVEAVFSDEQRASLPGAAREEATRTSVEEEESFQAVWEMDAPSEDGGASGVPYAALQRAASVQDLDVDDVAKALAHTQIAVRVLATQEQPDLNGVGEPTEAEEARLADDTVEPARPSSIPTDGVPYEALQRAVTEAENAQSSEMAEVANSLTEPVFMPPENGGAPWGRAVPFEDEANRVVVERASAGRKERAPEAQARA